MSSTLYSPQFLQRWTRPSDWSGTPWNGYYIAPVGITRDSGTLDRSNWSAQWDTLAPLSADVPDDDCTSPVIVREGHWAVGWIEWVAIHESNEAALREADEIASSLDNYPVLDDEARSAMEWEEYTEAWTRYGCRDFIRSLAREFGLSDSTVYRLQDADESHLQEWFQSLIPSGEYFTPESDGVSVRTDIAVRNLARTPNCRTILAQFLRSI